MIVSSSSSASDAGSRVKPSMLPVVRWSAGSKRRTVSISSPKKSRRSGCSSPPGLQHLGQPLDRDPLLGRELGHQLPDAEGRQRALRHRRQRGDDQLRPPGLGLERVKAGQPRGGGAQRRAGAIIGQAVPSRNLDNLQFRREGRRGVGDGAQLLLVGGDEQRAPVRRSGSARDVRQQPGLEAGGNAGKGKRRLGLQDFLEIGHSVFAHHSSPGRGGGRAPP